MNKLVEFIEGVSNQNCDIWRAYGDSGHSPKCLACAAKLTLSEHRSEPSADVVAVYRKKLECFYNFPSHPNCCLEDNSSASHEPAEYRQGWIDCYNAIYNRFTAIAAMQKGE